MATKILIENNKIIFDGHADDVETCQTITAICDALNADPAFTTIKYEPGYAEFEQLDGGEKMMFAVQRYVLESRYNDETGYSAVELASKGNIADRLDDLEAQISAMSTELANCKETCASLRELIEKTYLTISEFNTFKEELENQAKTVLPYTGNELIAKLNKLK